MLGKRRASEGGATRGGGTAKTKSVPIWTHDFNCLAQTDQDLVPDSFERRSLQMAGLGEDKITLQEDWNAQAIYDVVLAKFPKLEEGRGFELLKTHEKGSKLLHVVDIPPSGYDVPYLKAVAHNAMIYIRPLQRDLSLLPEKRYFSYIKIWMFG